MPVLAALLRRLYHIAPTIGVIWLFAGCGSTAAPERAHIRSSPRAVRAVVAAATATTRLTASVHLTRSPNPTSAYEAGAFDFARGTGSVVASHAPPSKLAGKPTWFAVYFPHAAFYQPPQNAGWKLPPAKPWIAIDLVEATSASPKLPRLIPQLESFNPLIALNEVAWGTVGAIAQGQQRVAGEATTRYLVTVDLRSALKKAQGPSKTAFIAAVGPQVRSLSGATVSGSASRATFHVWVTAKGRIMQLATRSLVGTGTRTTVIRASHASVSAQPPPRSRAVELNSILPSSERENTGGGDSDGA